MTSMISDIRCIVILFVIVIYFVVISHIFC